MQPPNAILVMRYQKLVLVIMLVTNNKSFTALACSEALLVRLETQRV